MFKKKLKGERARTPLESLDLKQNFSAGEITCANEAHHLPVADVVANPVVSADWVFQVSKILMTLLVTDRR